MPLTVHGENTATLILPADRGVAKPRTLRLKFLSKRETRSWQKRYAEATEMEDRDSRDAAYDVLLGDVVVGWENVDGNFSVDAISDKYSLGEFMQLFELIPFAMVPDATDLKK